MQPAHAALLAELERWHKQLSSQRPLRLPNGKRWRTERVGRRTVFVAPDGGAYIQAEPNAEPDVIIDWRGQRRMVLPPLRLRRFDREKALRRERRAARAQERAVQARTTKRRAER